MTGTSHAGAAASAFTLSRFFRAPRDLVFRVCTEPEHMKEWAAPKGSTIIAANMDFRPGGSYHYGTRAPDGHEMWGKVVYREISRPDRLVYVQSFSDPQGNLTRHPAAPAWPLELLTLFTFAEAEGGTLFTLRWSPVNATAEEQAIFDGAHEGMKGGWAGSLDRFEDYLATL